MNKDMKKNVISAGFGEVVEKKSKFIGELHPVSSADEAKDLVAAAKKKYYDARHHCYAYLLGEKGDTKKYSDDGEPQGTAGLPMLAVLEGRELTDCVVIVTRYFGGTLLGTGGLVRAYSKAAEAAAEDATFALKIPAERMNISAEYKDEGTIRRLIDAFAERGVTVEIESVSYSSNCDMIVNVESAEADALEHNITDTLAGRAAIERVAGVFMSRECKE